MKKLALVGLLALSACGLDPVMKQETACTVTTLRMAFNGDFSEWALPEFVPGKHRVAGRGADSYASCMPRPLTPWGY